jgi:hypothetical protein
MRRVAADGASMLSLDRTKIPVKGPPHSHRRTSVQRQKEMKLRRA